MSKASRLALGLMICAAAASVCYAVSPKQLSGSIVVSVMDSSKVPQMGATVLLFNRYDRLIQRVLTNDKGEYSFTALLPDIYSIRVNLASFLPAVKRDIVVQPGMQSLLNVSLASVFSSVELVYTAPGQSSIMSDDWKWVLRSASATRPVLRFLPKVDISDPSARQRSVTSAFSDTRGLVQLSAGADGFVSSLGNEPDLGTAFAVATSVYGSNQLQLIGNLGYSSRSGIPTAAFRTSFSHQLPDGMTTPEVTLTMRQLFLPARVGAALFSGQQNQVPQLRTMDVTLGDKTQISDRLQFDYGVSMESVSFLDQLNYLSPYGRLTYDPDPDTLIEFVFTSGLPPADLLTSSTGGPESDLHQNLTALALFPRVSMLAGRPRLLRSSSYELGYRKKFGSRAFSLSAYREAISNTTVTVAGADGIYPTSDLLPDLFSESSVFNVGQYYSSGYMLSVAQNLGDNLNLALMFGDDDALMPERQQLFTDSPGELRSIVRTNRRRSLTARIAGTSPWTGTEFMTSYQWTDFNSLTPGHAFLTQGVMPLPGLNVRIRQPLPSFGGLPGHFEATAELRNMLAQGYIPMLSPTGRRFYVMHTPRSVRGGLSFVF